MVLNTHEQSINQNLGQAGQRDQDMSWTRKPTARPQLSWPAIFFNFLNCLENIRRIPRGQEEGTTFASGASGQKEDKRRTTVQSNKERTPTVN